METIGKPGHDRLPGPAKTPASLQQQERAALPDTRHVEGRAVRLDGQMLDHVCVSLLDSSQGTSFDLKDPDEALNTYLGTERPSWIEEIARFFASFLLCVLLTAVCSQASNSRRDGQADLQLLHRRGRQKWARA
jgi:hypothetical protein